MRHTDVSCEFFYYHVHINLAVGYQSVGIKLKVWF